MSRPPKKPWVLDATSIFGDRVPPEETPAQLAERKRRATLCGHIKRKLLRDEPLTGELLEFALCNVGMTDAIAEKLKAGQPLDDHESHLMIDMYLVHARLKVIS